MEQPCRLHCIANGLLGNGLDVVISAMVYGKVTRCDVTFSFSFAASKGRRSVWDETWPMMQLRIERNAYARQLRGVPDDLPFVCKSHVARGRLTYTGYIESCNHTTSESGLTTFHGRNVAMTSYAAFMPPGVSHDQFLELYSSMARQLRVSSSISGPDHNQSYYSPCLGRQMVGVHLRTGRTTHDLKCSTQRGKEATCNPANESRFDIPLEAVKAATKLVAKQHFTPVGPGRVFIAFDDRTHVSDTRYRGYSTLDMLRDLFPAAWYARSAIRALWSFDDHRLLSTATALVAYEFSSFSWTAAQMGGVPYYVLRCTEKCQKYMCTSCSSGSVGVKLLPALNVANEHRTGQPLDEHRGERHGRAVQTTEPTARQVPWRYDGCHGIGPKRQLGEGARRGEVGGGVRR